MTTLLMEIPFMRAWAYCFTQMGYVVTLLVAFFLLIAAIYFGKKNYAKTGNQWVFIIIFFIGGALFLGALLGKPAEVAANTTVEQADRGVFIW